MAWGMVNVNEQRMRFVVCASRREKTLQQLCKEFRISRPTGYQWLRRYQAGGIGGVVEKSRRPHHSPTQTAPEIKQRVIALRQQRPDWGARKLQVLLAQEGVKLPVISMHRILLRHDLVRPQDRHRAAVQRFQRAAPNQLWQMDFKGPGGWDAPVGPLSVLDDHSRYAIALHGTWCTQAEPVREGLEEAFQRCGVPEEMLMRNTVVEHAGDHGLDMADGVADEAGHSDALQRIPASADARQGGTVSWLAGRSDETAWLAGRGAAPAVVRRVSS